jgi:hypothetical protein
MNLKEFLEDRVTRIIAAWGFLSVAIYVFVFLFSNGEDWGWELTYVPYDGAAVLAFVVLVFVVRFYGKNSFEGKVWTLITAGFGLWMTSELIWGFDIVLYALGYEGLPFTASVVTDPIFLCGYIVILMGFYYKMKYTKLYVDWSKISVVVAFTALFGIIATYLVTVPVLDSADLTGFDKFFQIAFVVLDIVLLNAALVVALYWGSEVSAGWHILATGLIFMMVADVGYSALGLRGVYFDGAFIELAWIAAYLLIGLAGHYQKRLHASFM